ncbi:MAG: sugar transferase [Ruminococcaceae bacterium]|nr:sugar transferase [Oscillospiraceae bacterium]
MKKLQFFIKRFFDFIFSFFLAVCSSPFLLIAMLIVKCCSPESPVIFKQERIGYKGKPFTVFKLRSMTNERDADGNLLPDEVRLKKWGKIIRKTNLDEIPQIFNILIGQMSFIGPRPLLAKEMVVMNADEQAKRQSLLPGISGWEAINEEKTSTRREMAEYDLYYVDHWSLLMDTKIFFMTIFLIFGFGRPDDSVRAPKIEYEIAAEAEAKEETETKEVTKQ